MNARNRKFFSYYKPYRTLLVADLICACITSAIVLALPLLVRTITQDVLASSAPNAIQRIVGEPRSVMAGRQMR